MSIIVFTQHEFVYVSNISLPLSLPSSISVSIPLYLFPPYSSLASYIFLFLSPHLSLTFPNSSEFFTMYSCPLFSPWRLGVFSGALRGLFRGAQGSTQGRLVVYLGAPSGLFRGA